MDKQLSKIENINSDLQNHLSSNPNNKSNNNNYNNNNNYLTEDKPIDDKNMLKFLENKMKEMETEYDIEENLVIDLGSAYTKIGFSGEDLPRIIIPSIYCKLKTDPNNKTEINLEKAQYLYGDEYYHPDRVNDKDLYEKTHLQQGDHTQVIDKEFLYFLKEIIENKLSIIPGDFNVLVNHSAIKNKENICALSKIFLDEFLFKGLALVNSSSLSLFATGNTTGIVVDCGESKTNIVPIYEGFPLYHALNKSKIGGEDISNVLYEQMIQLNPEINLPQDALFKIREIKDKMSFVAYENSKDWYIKNINEDVLSKDKILYELPSKEIIEIPKKARLNSSEVLFE